MKKLLSLGACEILCFDCPRVEGLVSLDNVTQSLGGELAILGSCTG